MAGNESKLMDDVAQPHFQCICHSQEHVHCRHLVSGILGIQLYFNSLCVTWPVENGDVERGCSADGPVLLGYWSFNDGGSSPWLGNYGQEPLNAYGLQNPVSPWGNALQVDTNTPANLSYRYMEENGLGNINCINGAVSAWFKPDWNGGVGPGTNGQLLVLGDGTNSLWSLNVDATGSNLLFETGSNGVFVTYFTNAISSFSSNILKLIDYWKCAFVLLLLLMSNSLSRAQGLCPQVQLRTWTAVPNLCKSGFQGCQTTTPPAYYLTITQASTHPATQPLIDDEHSGTYNTTIAITYNPTNNSYITSYGGTASATGLERGSTDTWSESASVINSTSNHCHPV